MKILIDSDVCLDVLVARVPFVIDSAKIFMAMESKIINGVITAESFTNIYYILRKQLGKQDAMNKLIKIRSISSIGPVLSSSIDKALHSDWSDFEDALQHQIALECNCKLIVTRNIKDYKLSLIDVFSPRDFVKYKLSKS
ncbi:PIN domain-containing protein [Cyclonatronum proteinivorum]|uniref:PIN domain-containing protein n=1 Tax=Cyclonatronum proteinivorum TaxID=1457365 RepID=A0A345UPP5_9BACT|nr:PIN domain-containing protein [Cyclonatronum proteinivorum]AXJ02447.1 PIN domain-containing protein [Cyclonatronum proteinivorum]